MHGLQYSLSLHDHMAFSQYFSAFGVETGGCLVYEAALFGFLPSEVALCDNICYSGSLWGYDFIYTYLALLPGLVVWLSMLPEHRQLLKGLWQLAECMGVSTCAFGRGFLSLQKSFRNGYTQSFAGKTPGLLARLWSVDKAGMFSGWSFHFLSGDLKLSLTTLWLVVSIDLFK